MDPAPVTAPAILRFYSPLVLNTWLLTLVGPVLNVAIARGEAPRTQLAAFWLAFAVLLVGQGACTVLQQVTASQLARRTPLATLAFSAAVTGLGASVLVLAVAWTPAGDVVYTRLLPASPPTAALARGLLAWMSPIPLLVAVRGVVNGVAVAARRTHLLALATLVRVLVLAAMVAAFVGLRLGAGARPAAWALLAGAAAEASFMAGATLPLWGRHAAPRLAHVRPAACAPVFRVGLPLAVAGYAWSLTRPAASAIAGRLAAPDVAQAGLGVVIPILMVGCAPLWALFDVALVLPRHRADLRAVLRFSALTSLAFTAALAALTATPLRMFVLRLGFSLTPELERAVLPALGLIALEPVALAARAVAQGLLVRTGRGGALLAVAPLRLALTTAAGLALAARRPQANGAELAIALIIGGDMTDAMVYAALAARAIRRDPAALAGATPFATPGTSAAPDSNLERFAA